MKSGIGQAARALRKSPSRFHHGDLRAAVLEVATQAVEAAGAEALSVRAVARALKVSDAAVYRHFASREAILREVGASGLRRLFGAMADVMVPHQTPRDRLFEAGRAYVHYAVAHPHWFRLYSSRAFQDDAYGAATSEPPALSPRDPPAMERALKEALAQLVPTEHVDDHFRMLWGLAHGFAGIVIERMFRRVDRDEERLATAERGLARYVDMLARGNGVE